MPERTHLSIGEVLSLLREEFPDVTISKIRFLESQGLVDPERTPSGYRKFYEHDVERLRWILRQQRENFLPLKVIRGRLSDQGDERDTDGTTEALTDLEPSADATITGYGPGSIASSVGPAGVNEQMAVAHQLAGLTESSLTEQQQPPVSSARDVADPPDETETGREPEAVSGGPISGSGDPAPHPAPATTGRAATVTGTATSRRTSRDETTPSEAVASSPPRTGSGGLGDQTDTYTTEELAAAAGVDPELVTDLTQYGLIAAHAVVAGVPYFDEVAMTVTQTAGEFAKHGVEARHLRVWRNAADREADLFQQVVLPLLRQRNPQARLQASETLAELVRLGSELRSALVGRAVRDIR
jgi:DNA-binding transcriptional MerR regulator